MSFVKRLVLLCTAVLCSGVITAAAADEARDFVVGLNIMSMAESGEFEGEKPVTRAQMAEILSAVYGISDEYFGGESYFTDISTDSKYFSCINNARDFGIMQGYTDGTFKPEQTITYAEALNCMLRAAGYSDYSAAVFGGGNDAVLKTSAEIGITKGVTAEINTPVSREIMAELIYNTLLTDIMEVSNVLSNGEVKYSAVKDVTVLNRRMGIETVKGTLTSAGIMSMLGDNAVLSADKVTIDEAVYFNNSGCTYYDKLGYFGEFYIKTERVTEPELVYAQFDPKKNECITIPAEDISEAELNMISYYEGDSGKKKTVRLSSDLAVVYNGRLLSSFDESMFIPKHGKITIVENKLLIIYDMETYVINRFDYTNEMVYDMYSGKGIKLTDGSENMYLTDSGKDMGNPLYNSEYYSVLDVMRSAKGEILITVLTNKAFSGKVTAIDSENGSVFIDNKEYKLAKSFKDVYADESETVKLYEKLKVGTACEFYLNSYGQIAGCDIDFSSGYSYGYLIKAWETSEENEVMFKIYTREGVAVNYKNNTKIKVDNASGLKTSGAILNAVNGGVAQLIRYKVNSENLITEIITAKDNRAGQERFIKDEFTLDFKTDLSEKATRIYSFAVGANFSLGDGTTVFFVPNNLNDIKKFKTGDKALLSGDVRDADIELYDTDEAGVAKVIIYFSGGSGGAPTSNLWKSDAMVIEKLNQVIIEGTGEIGYEIQGYRAGKEVKLLCEDGELENYGTGNYWVSGNGGLYDHKMVKDLKAGDIILLETDTSGNVSGILLMFSPSERPASFKEIMSDGGTPTPNNHLAATSTHYGKVVKSYKSALLVNANSDGSNASWNKTFVKGNANVYLYDSKKDEVTMIAHDEIAVDDIVFIRKNLTTVKEVYVIR